MLDLAAVNFELGYNYLVKGDKEKVNSVPENEDTIDYINNKITEYLIALSNRVDNEGSKVVGSYFHVINDIERVGDHAYNFYETGKNMEENDIHFSDVAKEELDKLFVLVINMIDLSKEIFVSHDINKLSYLHRLENDSDDLSRDIRDNHYKRISRNECSGEASDIFATLVSELERVADHLTNVGYSVVNPTGDEE